MRKIKIVALLVRQHGFTKNAKVSPNLTVAHLSIYLPIWARVTVSKG